MFCYKDSEPMASSGLCVGRLNSDPVTVAIAFSSGFAWHALSLPVPLPGTLACYKMDASLAALQKLSTWLGNV